MKFYAGIGSRKTPQDVLMKMEIIALFLSKKNYILRSGGAMGADCAFEKASLKSEIYLPEDTTGKAKALALDYHPNPQAIMNNQYSLSLIKRNIEILLKKDLKNPIEFVIY